MRTRQLSRILSTALALCAALSCSGPTEPRFVGASYALVRIAGDALPTYAFITPGGSSDVLADTLRFHRDGTGASVAVLRSTSPGSTTSRDYRTEATFSYRLVGSHLEISFDCPPNASCVAPPHLIGRLTGSGIQFSFVLNERVPQDYVLFEGQ